MKNNLPKATKLSPFSTKKFSFSESFDFSERLNKKNQNNQKEYFENFVRLKKEKIQKFNTNFDEVNADIKNYVDTVNALSSKVTNISKDEYLNLLLFGFIQSGKTDFMIGLTLKLMQSYKNSNVSILLTTANTTLLKQTYDRFQNTFSNLGLNAYTLSYPEIKDLLENNRFEKILKSGKKVVIFLMKQKDHLSKCVELLETIRDPNIIDNVSILDDEGDTASFDNISKEEMTTIHANIKNLIGVSQKFSCAYIPVTATPFAHLMVTEDSVMKPDYAFVLYPGSAYVGVDYYSEESEKRNSKIIKIISNRIDAYEENQAVNPELISAIVNYLIQCVIFDVHSDYFHNRKPRMLINIQRRNETHSITRDDIYKILEDLKNPEWKEYNVDRYVAEALENYRDLPNSNNGINLSIPNNVSANQIFDYILEKIIDRVEPRIMNSDPDNIIDFHKMNLDEYQYEEFQIIIGSDKLGRGVTFVDLTTAFLARRSEYRGNGDTILQQARWLGYRQEYKELMKIYLLEDLIEDYTNLNTIINYLISIIKIYQNENKKFTNIDRKVPIKKYSQSFKLVRDAVSKTETTDGPKFHYMNNRYEVGNYSPIHDNNLNFLNKFYENYSGDSYGIYPVIYFENIEQFNQTFFNSNDFDILKDKYSTIFGLGKTDDSLKLLESLLKFRTKKVCVRLIHSLDLDVDFRENNNPNYKYRERKLNIASSNEIYSFGQGNYEEEYNIYATNGFICIDIIPIKVWSDKPSILSEPFNTFRARLFMPHEITKEFEFGIRAIDK